MYTLHENEETHAVRFHDASLPSWLADSPWDDGRKHMQTKAELYPEPECANPDETHLR